MKFKSIKQKLILIFILLIVLPLTLSSIITISTVKNSLQNQAKNELKTSSNLICKTITEAYEGYKSSISQMSKNGIIESCLTTDYVTIENELSKITSSNENILNAYVLTKNNNIFIYPERKLPNNFIPTNSKLYKDTKSKNGDILSIDAYKDIATGKMVVTLCKSIFDKNNTFVGIAAIDIDISNIKNLIKDIAIDNNGQVYLLDTTGVTIASKNDNVLGKNFNPDRKETELTKDTKILNIYKSPSEVSWMKNLMSGKSGLETAHFLNTNNFVYYMNNEASKWNIVVTMDKNILTKKIFSTLLLFIIVFIVFLIISILAALIISKSVTNPLNHLNEIMFKAEKGDLTQICSIKTNDEFGTLGKSFSNMTTGIKDLISSIKETSKKILIFSDTLKNQSNTSSISANEIASTMDEISAGVQQQATDAQISSEIALKFIDKLNEINTYSKEINNENLKMNDYNKEAVDAVINLKQKNDLTTTAVSTISKRIKELESYSENIGKISSVILSIASQTNLLSLNAAIEASRAGEAGKGFSVVADEVRKLSEQSSNSAEEIQNIISKIQNTTKETVHNMDNVANYVESQNDAVIITEQSFEELSKSIDNITATINNVVASIDELAQKSTILMESIESISSVSEQSAAAIEEITASASSQLNDMEKLKQESKNLNELAQILEKGVEKFKID